MTNSRQEMGTTHEPLVNFEILEDGIIEMTVPTSGLDTKPIPGARSLYFVNVRRGGETSTYQVFGCWDRQTGEFLLRTAMLLSLIAWEGDKHSYGNMTAVHTSQMASSSGHESFAPLSTSREEATALQLAIQESRIGCPELPPADEPLGRSWDEKSAPGWGGDSTAPSEGNPARLRDEQRPSIVTDAPEGV